MQDEFSSFLPDSGKLAKLAVELSKCLESERVAIAERNLDALESGILAVKGDVLNALKAAGCSHPSLSHRWPHLYALLRTAEQDQRGNEVAMERWCSEVRHELNGVRSAQSALQKFRDTVQANGAMTGRPHLLGWG